MVTPEFRAIGFKYSMSLVSTVKLTARDHDVAGMISGVRETTNSINGGPVTHTAVGNRGDIALVIAGYGSAAGGEEYSNTKVTVSVNPRSWCPGGLIPSRYFPTGDITGKSAAVTIGIGRRVPYVGDSGYRTSVSLLEH